LARDVVVCDVIRHGDPNIGEAQVQFWVQSAGSLAAPRRHTQALTPLSVLLPRTLIGAPHVWSNDIQAAGKS